MTKNVDAVLRDVSDTALITAAHRGWEGRRQRPLFDDRYALQLAGARGQALARQLTSRLVASGVIVRTSVFDEWITRAIHEAGVGCVLCLGAGLDARPYRLDLRIRTPLPRRTYSTLLAAHDATMLRQRGPLPAPRGVCLGCLSTSRSDSSMPGWMPCTLTQFRRRRQARDETARHVRSVDRSGHCRAGTYSGAALLEAVDR